MNISTIDEISESSDGNYDSRTDTRAPRGCVLLAGSERNATLGRGKVHSEQCFVGPVRILNVTGETYRCLLCLLENYGTKNL